MPSLAAPFTLPATLTVAGPARLPTRFGTFQLYAVSDAKTGNAIDQGTVAVKITDPTTGQAGAAIALMGMGGHFGADVALMAKGEYQFTVGTKLADGGKRQYSFRYTVK